MIALALLAVSALQALQHDDQRVADIGFRLATKGTSLCPATVISGIRAHALRQYGRGDGMAAEEYFALGSYPAVLALAKGSQAERAGIHVNDWIVTINGEDMRDTLNLGYAVVQRVENALERGFKTGRPVVISVKRNGALNIYELTGDRGCASDVELVPSRKLNAKADGRVVQVTTGVLAETRDDDELAFIIAHEMAHNILRHAEKSGPRRAEEIEADRLGLKLMKAAGYDPLAAARFWERFGRKTGAGIFSDGRHLRTNARIQLLRHEAVNLAQ